MLKINDASYRSINKYYKLRASYYRMNRMLFPSPAELKLIEIMGGKVIRIKFIKHHETGFKLAFVLSMGKILKAQKFEREVKAGKCWIDFGNDIQWGIEVDGKQWHRNVVKEFERAEYLSGFCDRKCQKKCQKHLNVGWRIKHIDAVRLYNEPAKVQAELLKFLNV